jgi:enoyl-CoA hydratase
VLLIGIDRPEAQNRFDAPMLIGLGNAYHQLDHEDELRAAVLYGVGRDFCLGVDRGAFAAAQAAGQLPPKDPDYINPVGLKPPYRSKPVVIAVHGGTKYLGHELFLASDIRVAADDALLHGSTAGRSQPPAATFMGGERTPAARVRACGARVDGRHSGSQWELIRSIQADMI